MTAPAQVLPTTLGTCAREGRPWPGPTVDEGRLAVQAAFDGAVANLWEASWLNPTQGQRELKADLALTTGAIRVCAYPRGSGTRPSITAPTSPVTCYPGCRGTTACKGA